MNQIRWGLWLSAAVFIPLACFFLTVYQDTPPRKAFKIYKLETTQVLPGDTNMRLSPESIQQLNDELDAILRQRAPHDNFHYSVVSLGKNTIEVTATGDSEIPFSIRKALDDHIRQRLPQLTKPGPVLHPYQ